MRRVVHWASGIVFLAIVGAAVPVAVVADEQFANRETMSVSVVLLVVMLLVFAATTDSAVEWKNASRERVHVERERVRDLRAHVLAVESELTTYRDRLAKIIADNSFSYSDRDRLFRALQWQGRRDDIGRDGRADAAYALASAAYRCFPRINEAIRQRVPPRYWTGVGTYEEPNLSIRDGDDFPEVLDQIDAALASLKALRERL